MASPSRRVRAILLGVSCLAVVIGLAAWFWPRPRYNLLVITLDTTRADYIGCYGRSQALTPALDALANSGVLFENAYAAVPMTLPSHATIFTGLYPPEHGLHTNGHGRLQIRLPTLAEVLAKNGYETGGFAASFILHSKFGLNRGFRTYDDDMAGGESFGGETHLVRNGKLMADAALSWLRKHSGKPFFCWVHLYDPHEPYDPHEESFGDRFRDSPYDGDIAFADQQIGRLIDYLKASGLDEQTIVVVVGDHGEGLGEHEEREHGFMVYNATVRVPLIVACPPLCLAGHRVSTPVSLVDLFPTVLDCLQVKSPRQISGQSLRSSLSGADIEPHLCYAEAETPFISYGWSPQQSLSTDAWKYIKTSREELYDLRVDPHELNNLAQSQPQRLVEMRHLLSDVTDRMISCPTTESQLSESDRRKLESLGYLSGSIIDPPLTESLPDVKDMIGPYNAELDARELLDAGKFAEAEAKLREVIKVAPGFMIARASLGRALQKQKRIDDAVVVYEEILKLQPDNAEAHFDLGNILAARGELDAAIEHYSAVLQTDRLTSVAHINLAEVYAFKGETDLARYHYEEALEEFPDSASGHFNYGMFLAKQGIIDEALFHIDRAVKLLPGNPQMRYHLGSILLSLGRFDEAQAQLEETLRLDPQHPLAQAELEQARARQPPSQ